VVCSRSFCSADGYFVSAHRNVVACKACGDRSVPAAQPSAHDGVFALLSRGSSVYEAPLCVISCGAVTVRRATGELWDGPLTFSGTLGADGALELASNEDDGALTFIGQLNSGEQLEATGSFSKSGGGSADVVLQLTRLGRPTITRFGVMF
jgi:hypothetical protein